MSVRRIRAMCDVRVCVIFISIGTQIQINKLPYSRPAHAYCMRVNGGASSANENQARFLLLPLNRRYSFLHMGRFYIGENGSHSICQRI